MNFIQARLKTIVALAGVILMYLQAYQTAHPNQWVSVAIALLTAISVHQVPNKK